MSSKIADESRDDGLLRRALRRFTATQHELDAEDLEVQVSEFGALPCREAATHESEQACIVGRLRNVRFTPRTNLPTLEAELYDGTGSVTLIWLGRRRIPGIEPGRTVVVRGRISDQGLRRVIFNPWYELRPAAQ
ncbi:MAG: OB-fold nucleic acid binding domain-containing protein [Mycobacteriales bacterium]